MKIRSTTVWNEMKPREWKTFVKNTSHTNKHTHARRAQSTHLPIVILFGVWWHSPNKRVCMFLTRQISLFFCSIRRSVFSFFLLFNFSGHETKLEYVYLPVRANRLPNWSWRHNRTPRKTKRKEKTEKLLHIFGPFSDRNNNYSATHNLLLKHNDWRINYCN